MIASASRGSARLQCRLFEEAVGDFGNRPSTHIGVLAIDIRSVTSASAALRSEPASAASTPHIRCGRAARAPPLDIVGEADLAVEVPISRRRQTG